jgi:hypothetical protein
MDNPPGAGLPTSPTTAWTTLCVDHMPTTPAAAKDFLLFSKDQRLKKQVKQEVRSTLYKAKKMS